MPNGWPNLQNRIIEKGEVMKRKSHKLSYLSALVMFNLGVLTLPAQAQENAEEQESQSQEEETVNDDKKIVIHGIRGALERSMDIKRDAKTFVDAITAEDIGKFPDQNLAESLQRVSGVAIDRDGGEGQLVSVRGLGSDFNMTLLDGRSLASISGGRGFSYDVIAAELIAGAQVHKTQSASLVEGSTGATINLDSFKPFHIDGFRIVTTGKVIYDEMTGTTNPQLSGLVSNTFMDNRFGVLASFNFADREYRTDQAQNDGFRHFDELSYVDPDTNDTVTLNDVTLPRNYDQIAKLESRKRQSGTLVFQFKPNEDMVLTADYLYSRYEADYSEHTLAHWFDEAWLSGIQLDENRTAVQLDFLGSRGGKTDFLNRESTRPTTTDLMGINFKWDVNADIRINSDFYRSTAESDNFDGWTDTVVGYRNDYSYDYSSGAGLPSLVFAEPWDTSNLTGGWGERGGDLISDEIEEAKLELDWNLQNAGPLTNIKLGASNFKRELFTRSGRTNWPLVCAICDYVTMPADMFSTYNADGFLSAVSGNPVNEWIIFSSEDFFSFAGSDAALSQLPADAWQDRDAVIAAVAENPDFRAGEIWWHNNYTIEEESTAFYMDAYFEGDKWAALLGLRHVENKTSGKGTQWYILDLIPSTVDPTQVAAVWSDDVLPVEVNSKYSKLLPSFNFRYEISDDVIARAGYSESMTRPDITAMGPRTEYDGGGTIGELTGSGGNPDLQPYESKNLDLGIEWYYDSGSYVALNYYKKDIDGYIDWEEGETPEILSVPSGDYEVIISRPRNLHSAEIKGSEFVVQHMFNSLPYPWNGFGVIYNATNVEGESTEDEPNKPFQVGLGDTQNLVLFYEGDNFEARIAYNHRDEFYQYWHWRGHPVFVKDYSQIDLSASYDINENLSVFFEGINVTNETYEKRAWYDNQMMSISETGPRYSIGLRADF